MNINELTEQEITELNALTEMCRYDEEKFRSLPPEDQDRCYEYCSLMVSRFENPNK